MKSAARFLPGMIASFMLMTGTGKAQAAAEPAWEENGQASWYGSRHHGRRTSSGQIFDQNAMTAAHSNLPLGSRVRVTLEDTGRSVVVTINDRLPPKGLRVIDLSRGAAARLGIVSRGVGMVQLTTAAPDTADEPVEVAEAPDEIGAPAMGRVSPRRRDRLHKRPVRPSAAADRPCCRAPSATPARHSTPRRAAPRRL
ncbi:MAG: septal ring lytic transglycosylase RlpA family protein [Gemmatimonadaceae bacterium]|nr:septal ring lytic transglycosylase RlpA family protein [Acetobacteraceae bacterium]